jgi:hypothetical protein
MNPLSFVVNDYCGHPTMHQVTYEREKNDSHSGISKHGAAGAWREGDNIIDHNSYCAFDIY